MSKRDKGKVVEEPTEMSRTRSSSVFGSAAADKSGRSTWSPSKAKKAVKGFDEKMFANTDSAMAIGKLLEEMAGGIVKHPSLVDNKDNSDACFYAGGSPIYSHRAVIAVRCPNLLVKNIKEKPTLKKGVITIRVADNVVDETSLGFIIAYLYTDEISFLNMEKDQVVRLMLVAGLYELERVVWLCERYLKGIVTLDNWFSLLRTASNFNVVRARMLLMQYGAGKFKEIIQKKEGVALLGLELFREFVVYCTIPPETLPVDPETKSIPSTMKADFQKIYSEIQYTDSSARLSGDNKPVLCHAAFLIEQSESLGKVLVASHASDDHNVRDQRELELPKNAVISAGAFQAFLKWAYYKEEKIDPTHAAELVPFSRHFFIESLSKLCEEIIKQGINENSVIPILSLCYNKDVSKYIKKDVYQPSLDFVLSHFTNVEFKPLRKKTAAISADILKLCQQSIQKGIWKDAEELKVQYAGASAAAPSATTSGTGTDSTSPTPRAQKKKDRKSFATEESTDDSSDQKDKINKKKRNTSSVDDLDKVTDAKKGSEEKKVEEKKVEDKKPEEKKVDDKKPEEKKADEKKPEEKKEEKPEVKTEDKKPEEPKAEVKPEEVKKVETPEAKAPEEASKPEAQPAAAKPAETKDEPKQADAKPENPKKDEGKVDEKKEEKSIKKDKEEVAASPASKKKKSKAEEVGDETKSVKETRAKFETATKTDSQPNPASPKSAKKAK